MMKSLNMKIKPNRYKVYFVKLWIKEFKIFESWLDILFKLMIVVYYQNYVSHPKFSYQGHLRVQSTSEKYLCWKLSISEFIHNLSYIVLAYFYYNFLLQFAKKLICAKLLMKISVFFSDFLVNPSRLFRGIP